MELQLALVESIESEMYFTISMEEKQVHDRHVCVEYHRSRRLIRCIEWMKVVSKAKTFFKTTGL